MKPDSTMHKSAQYGTSTQPKHPSACPEVIRIQITPCIEPRAASGKLHNECCERTAGSVYIVQERPHHQYMPLGNKLSFAGLFTD